MPAPAVGVGVGRASPALPASASASASASAASTLPPPADGHVVLAAPDDPPNAGDDDPTELLDFNELGAYAADDGFNYGF